MKVEPCKTGDGLILIAVMSGSINGLNGMEALTLPIRVDATCPLVRLLKILTPNKPFTIYVTNFYCSLIKAVKRSYRRIIDSQRVIV